jgi:D-alanyl-D-alanine carboxypeptidase/D-alanyl-D-alanine-endopeptidase (penicillin-binding protein 4)
LPLAFVLTSGLQPAVALTDLPPDYRVLAPVDPVVAVDSQRLEQRIDRAWRTPALGNDKALAVDAFSGGSALAVGIAENTPLMPASTTKLLTAVAVLETLGPEHRFTTTVTRSGNQVFLVGGGDPQLTTSVTTRSINADASLPRLARRTAAALQAAGVDRVRLRYDATLFDPPAEQPFWGPDFLSIGVVAPITALSADGGRLRPPASPRSPDPPLTAAEAFARLLGARGIDVIGEPVARVKEGEEIASVQSAPLADLVEHLLLTSDNTEAEILAHHVGLAVLDDPTFSGGAAATLQVLSDLGVDTGGITLNDGSGLARSNRISPQTLLEILRTAVEEDPQRLWPVYTGLPVAGFDGSLTSRFSAPSAKAGRGAVTGKTGTLTGTSTLAGLATDRDGQLLMYAVMTNDVNVFAASPAIDDVVARIAGCRCAQQTG